MNCEDLQVGKRSFPSSSLSRLGELALWLQGARLGLACGFRRSDLDVRGSGAISVT